MDYRGILKKYWGYDDFRPLQLDIIESVCSGHDTFALLPTGAGKSVTYQLPAVVMDGMAIVVTPLIALMEDQVKSLKTKGIRAAGIHSGMTRGAILDTFEQAELGAYRLLYVSPERLSSPLFQKRLLFLDISLIAVDEAHCISQWGYDFRPHYLKISSLRDALPDVPLLALTASATPDVADDIMEKLSMRTPRVIKGSFARKNLDYVVRHVDNKAAALPEMLTKVGGSAVVYVRQRNACKEWADILNAAGITAVYYHAGLQPDEKKKSQESWMRGDARVMVATTAFGMGIDKPDVRMVIHVDLPDSIEAYYQEAGRAGRDGQRAYPLLLTDSADVTRLRRRTSNTFPPKEYIAKVYQSLANFYIVGVGSGDGSVYPFDLVEFCTACHLNQALALNSIKILEMAGYITLTDEMDNPSKLRFIVSRDDLYHITLTNPLHDRVIETLLRLYTGIFTDAVHISEDEMSRLLNVPRNDIYNALVQLSRMQIVKYIPFRKTPLLIYQCDRVDSEELYIPKNVYELRQERYMQRIKAMVEYANQETVCRERYLTRYFGQDEGNCGHCDVCRARKKGGTFSTEDTGEEKGISEYDDSTLRSRMLSLIGERPIAVQSLMPEYLRRLHVAGQPMMYDRYKARAADILHALLDEDAVRIDHGRYHLK